MRVIRSGRSDTSDHAETGRSLEWPRAMGVGSSRRVPTIASSWNVTQLLVNWSNGDQAALEKLLPLVNGELGAWPPYMRKEGPDTRCRTSALVNEAYLRLVDQKKVHWQNRLISSGLRRS